MTRPRASCQRIVARATNTIAGEKYESVPSGSNCTGREGEREREMCHDYYTTSHRSASVAEKIIAAEHNNEIAFSPLLANLQQLLLVCTTRAVCIATPREFLYCVT
jgi:hypothetical protein